MMPVLFTCPHHGRRGLDELCLRDKDHLPDPCKKDPGVRFSAKNDTHTHELTDSIVSNISSLSGKEPYKQIAYLHRKYVDYNRREECAFEQSCLEAKQSYLKYHNDILQKIEEMLSENENGLAFLFDIHGTDHEVIQVGGQNYSFEVLIGTDEECSIKALTQIHPNPWWDDNKGLIPLLKDKDILVFPSNKDLELQNHFLDGGYTIQTYGSYRFKKRLAAIQIEVIHPIRKNPDRREKLAADMAECIWNFVCPYI